MKKVLLRLYVAPCLVEGVHTGPLYYSLSRSRLRFRLVSLGPSPIVPGQPSWHSRSAAWR
jgi:hypothetical protein